MFFMVASGAFLQALNCKALGNKRGFYLTAIFGVAYSLMQIWVLTYLEDVLGKSTNGLTQGFCGIGAIVLDYYFWDKFIGKETQYRTRPIWKPLVICILLTIPIILAVIYGS